LIEKHISLQDPQNWFLLLFKLTKFQLLFLVRKIYILVESSGTLCFPCRPHVFYPWVTTKNEIDIAGIAILHTLYMHITCSDHALMLWTRITWSGLDIVCKITCSHSTARNENKTLAVCVMKTKHLPLNIYCNGL